MFSLTDSAGLVVHDDQSILDAIEFVVLSSLPIIHALNAKHFVAASRVSIRSNLEAFFSLRAGVGFAVDRLRSLASLRTVKVRAWCSLAAYLLNHFANRPLRSRVSILANLDSETFQVGFVHG